MRTDGSRLLGVHTGADRAPARWEAFLFGLVVAATDLLPPRIRYGYVHPVTRRLFHRPLPMLPATIRRSAPPAWSSAPASGIGTLTCAMIVGSIDVGGIGSLVEVLAAAFPAAGVAPVILCTEDGTRAERLRSHGIDVVVCRSEADAEGALRELAPDVIQLHGASEYLEAAAIRSGIPLVTVLHNTEIHFSRARWKRFTRVLRHSRACVAVSESVRGFHAAHVPDALAARITVVGNAIPPESAPDEGERTAARVALERILQAELNDDVILASLTRYDSQKNVAGLVASFLSSVTVPNVRLVIAGDPSDWAEMRRADAVRRCSAAAERVSLLGLSDARTLLAAADAFILDSFFEGWPVAATEAAALGLPLILADFGGAQELVGRDPAHSVLIPNACGPADAVSDAAVARARRECRRQSNALALGAAVDAVAVRVLGGSRPLPRSGDALMAEMVEGHAQVLRRAAQQEEQSSEQSSEPRVPSGEGARWAP